MIDYKKKLCISIGLIFVNLLGLLFNFLFFGLQSNSLKGLLDSLTKRA